MLTWAVIKSTKTDEFVEAYRTVKDAVCNAERNWTLYMTEADRKACTSYIVGLVNLDEDGDYVELEDGTIDADVRIVAVDFVNDVWDIDGLLAKYGMSKAELSRRYDIPYRTIQNWTDTGSNRRKCPFYVTKMLQRLMRIDEA